MTIVTEPQLRTTPLHDDHVAAEARMVDFAGWSMPLQYESTKAEHMAVREAAGMFDVSHMGRIELTGPQAQDALQLIVSNDVSKMLVGDSQYSVMCRPDGGVIDDLLVYRLADEHYLVIVNAANFRCLTLERLGSGPSASVSRIVRAPGPCTAIIAWRALMSCTFASNFALCSRIQARSPAWFAALTITR